MIIDVQAGHTCGQVAGLQGGTIALHEPLTSSKPCLHWKPQVLSSLQIGVELLQTIGQVAGLQGGTIALH